MQNDGLITGGEQILRLQTALDSVQRMNGSVELIKSLQKAIQVVRENMNDRYQLALGEQQSLMAPNDVFMLPTG